MATTGHCLCGAVLYAYVGEPLWVAHCHCESCRRQTSSAFATFVGVARDKLRFEGAGPVAYESSPGVFRTFCGRCGAPIAYANEARFPGEVHLYAGTLTDPAAIKPTAHVHVAEQLPWGELHDDLPRYERGGGKGAKPVRRGPKR